MSNPSVYSPRERCHPSIVMEISSSKPSVPQQRASRLFRRCLQSIDRPAPETSLLDAAALELRTPRRVQFVQFESSGSRAHSRKPDASSSVLPGAALSVVPGRSGIVCSRIAAFDVDEPLRLLVRGLIECLGLLIHPPDLSNGPAFTFPTHATVWCPSQPVPASSCVRRHKSLPPSNVFTSAIPCAINIAVDSTQNYTALFCVCTLRKEEKGGRSPRRSSVTTTLLSRENAGKRHNPLLT